mmetsp:Transcript_227/g.241  ORF Transcript_227/g.241 Transcript_227/m.241 type:complete len:110 (-) Transcript_227:37-366(-)
MDSSSNNKRNPIKNAVSFDIGFSSYGDKDDDNDIDADVDVAVDDSKKKTTTIMRMLILMLDRSKISCKGGKNDVAATATTSTSCRYCRHSFKKSNEKTTASAVFSKDSE